jgi:signal peptidase II
MAETTHHTSNDRPVVGGNVSDPPGRPSARGVQIAVVGSIAIVVLVLDQFAKSVALQRLPAGVPIPIVEGLAAFTLVLNPGLAFGILRAVGPEHWWLMALLSIAALALVVRMAFTMLPDSRPALRAAFGLILGGAAGNLVDRVRLGGVVDFIDLSWGLYHWPAFNTADAALSVGVVILMGHMLVSGSSKPGADRRTPLEPHKESPR